MRQRPGTADCIGHGDATCDATAVEARLHVVEHAAFAAEQMRAAADVEQ